MTIRKKRLLAAAAASFLAVAVIGYWFVGDRFEPHHKGRSLTYWLAVYDDLLRDSKPGTREEAVAAVQAIGTNALPHLLQWIQYTPTRGRLVFDEKARTAIDGALPRNTSERLARVLFRDEFRSTLAVAGYELLGPKAAGAIPDLMAVAQGTNLNNSFQAIEALGHIGSESVSGLQSLLVNRQFPNRSWVAYVLGRMGEKSPTTLLAVVPDLARCAEESNPRLVSAAVRALGRIRLRPDIAMPPLMNALQSTNSRLQSAALESIARFGPEASPALPLVVAASTNREPDLRHRANEALRAILLTNAPPSHP